MGTFQIEGGHKLKGEITPQGAKNEALQILCAVLLTPEKVIIENIPDILDVNKLIKILENLGVKIQKLGKGKFAFTADDINLEYLESELFKQEGSSLRGSIMIVGPILGTDLEKDIFQDQAVIKLEEEGLIPILKVLSILAQNSATIKKNVFMGLKLQKG